MVYKVKFRRTIYLKTYCYYNIIIKAEGKVLSMIYSSLLSYTRNVIKNNNFKVTA